MNNQRHYSLIDSLVITRNGNQLKTIEDYAEKDLTYTGASDFYDGCTYSNEYSYNDNGALDMDQNRDIDMIMYDRLGNTREIWFYDHSNIEYIYAADGTKLRTIHRPASSSALTDSIDFIGNLILNNGQPSMYLFDGGYATFNSNGAVNGWHYYISDYMGNNRMVVNKNGTTEQITHYYPYGGVIGDISTNESLQKYKFEGKELDRTFGLDNYDIHSRQYFAMMPSWDKIDPMAEKYYGISPYAYCGGYPVNFGDYNGEDAIVSVYGDTITISANVILTGSQASQELADIYQQGINETWGSISTFEHEGKTYNLVWDIKVEANAGLDINDNLPRDGRTNYLQVIGEPRSGGKGSSVIYGYKGFIRAYGEDGLSLNESNPLPHEFGHLIGLKDRYYTRTDEERNLGKYGHPHPG